jgi:hypothetical protein
MTPRWGKLPPIMERTLRDDVKLFLCVLVGAALGSLVFGADAGLLRGFAIGAAAMIVVLNVFRFVVRHVGTRRDD